MKDALIKVVKVFAVSIPMLGALITTLAFGCESEIVVMTTLMGLVLGLFLMMVVFD